MMRGLWKLTWLEVKIFAREPLGFVGALALPVLIFALLGRLAGLRGPAASRGLPRFISVDLPILASMVFTISAVLSLVAIIAIYREGGILKRLRATPLRPHTILTAHVLVKVLFSALTLGLMMLAGRRVYPVAADVPLASFTLALIFTTVCLLSMGFLIASLVPTARFAQPMGAMILYPMMGLSGLFVPVEAFPPALQTVARLLPLTYGVSLLRGIWHGEGWAAHAGDVGILALMLVIFLAISSRVFRWE
jgi:ABC-2 type transport system permease protein